MDTKTLCLGVLTSGDRSGYEIKKVFEEAFSHFFAAGYGSIYPALAELARQGLVGCTSVEQEKRPDKKVYAITPAGRRALVEDLARTEPRHRLRSEFLVLMYFAHLLPPRRVGEVIDGMTAQWQTLLDGIERCDADAKLSPGLRFTIGYAQTVLAAARAYVQSQKGGLLTEIEALAADETPAEAAE
jgi:PadR family transcriptional regulator, regulatory protein AphA